MILAQKNQEVDSIGNSETKNPWCIHIPQNGALLLESTKQEMKEAFNKR